MWGRGGRKDRDWGRICERQQSIRITDDDVANDTHHTEADDLVALCDSDLLALLG